MRAFISLVIVVLCVCLCGMGRGCLAADAPDLPPALDSTVITDPITGANPEERDRKAMEAFQKELGDLPDTDPKSAAAKYTQYLTDHPRISPMIGMHAAAELGKIYHAEVDPLKNPRLNTAVLTILCGVAANIGRASAQPLGPDAKPEDAIRFIAAGVEHSREQFQSGQATVTCTHFISKQYADLLLARSRATLPANLHIDIPDQDQEDITVGHWYYKGQQFSMSVDSTIPPSGGHDLHQRILVKDDVAKHLCNTIVTSRRTIGPDPPPYQGVIQRPEDALQHGFWAPGSDADPRSYSFLVDAGSEPLTDMLLKSQPPVVYEGKKQVHGVECMVVQKTVQGSSKESYLFDAAHGFLVRRRELSTWLGGKWVLVAETDVPRVIESGGVWLPESIESKDRLSSMLPDGGSAAGHPAGSPAPGGVEKGSGMVGPMETAILVTISDFRANCDLPPEAFVLDWPLGTVVSDNIHHKRFIVTTTDITPK